MTTIVAAVAAVDSLRERLTTSHRTITALVAELGVVRRQLADTRAELEATRAALAWRL